MKIMVISPTNIFPPVHGGPSRTYYFCKYLAKSHSLVLVSPPPAGPKTACTLPVDFHELNRPGRAPQFFDPVFLSRATKLIRRLKPDLIQVEFVWPGLHALVLRMLTGVPFVLNAHNVEFARRRRMGSPIWPLLWLYETLVCRQADLVLCVSAEDRELFIRLGTPDSRIAIVPNGFDSEVFFPSDHTPSYDRLGFERQPTVLFFGALEYMPNRQAIDIILEEIVPRVTIQVPNVRFVIAGRNPPPVAKRLPNLVLTGAVERIQDFLNAADVSICPILIGGGTRLKIIESLACGKPVVSTSVGAEGLSREAIRQGVTIADNWDDFARAITGALANPVTFEVTETFVETYSWKRIVANCPYNYDVFSDSIQLGMRNPTWLKRSN